MVPQVELDPPPGDWAAAASPTNDDPAVAPPDRRAVLGSQRLWPDWDSILHDRSLLKDGPFFFGALLKQFTSRECAGAASGRHRTVPVGDYTS